MGTTDCLVVGHYDQSLEDLAARVLAGREASGGYCEVRTNCIVADGLHLSYAEVFNRLCERAWGIMPGFNPFHAPHAGVIYLVNRLRRVGVRAEPLHYVSAERLELTRSLRELQPKVVVITTTFYVQSEPVVELIDHIKDHLPEAFVVVGGPFVASRTIGSTEVSARLAKLGADALIVDAQGEQSLLALVDRVLRSEIAALAAIPNLIACDAGQLVATTRVEVEDNSLEQNRIHWAEFERDLSPPLAFVRTARGCPFRCAFCNYPAMAGGQHHLASVESICAELEELAALGVRHVAFVDDTFNVPLPRFKRLLTSIIERGLDLRWTSFFRCSNADEECFDLMAEAGCHAVFLGIESGDLSVLKAMNKAARPEAYRRGIAALSARGILTMASYVIGFPGETAETVQRTLAFMADYPTTFHNVQLYYHDSLAPIERRRAEFEIQGTGYAWEHRTMDWREASDWVHHAMCLQFGSVPLPLYGFSIWSLPYFEALGFTRDTFVDFARLAAEIFQSSLTAPDRALALDQYADRFAAMLTREDIEGSLLRCSQEAT
jgi:p-methyltransferase